MNSGERYVHIYCHISQSINISGYAWLHVGWNLKALLKCFMGEGSRALSHVYLDVHVNNGMQKNSRCYLLYFSGGNSKSRNTITVRINKNSNIWRNIFKRQSSCTHNNKSGHLEMVIIVNVVPVASVLLRHSNLAFVQF